MLGQPGRVVRERALFVGFGQEDDIPSLSGAFRFFQVVPVEPAPGDFNGDGDVDAADLASWSAGFGTTGNATQSQGDADGDHDVDGADFLVWQQQLGSGAAVANSTTIPEPRSLALIALAVSAFGLRWRGWIAGPRSAIASSVQKPFVDRKAMRLI